MCSRFLVVIINKLNCRSIYSLSRSSMEENKHATVKVSSAITAGKDALIAKADSATDSCFEMVETLWNMVSLLWSFYAKLSVLLCMVGTVLHWIVTPSIHNFVLSVVRFFAAIPCVVPALCLFV